MYYVDTSVLVSYVFASDPGHSASQKILEDIAIKQRQKLYASSFTLVETCNTICKKIIIEKWRLIDPLQEYVDIYRNDEEKCRFLLSLIINFLRERLSIEFIDEKDFYDLVPTGFNALRMPRVFKEAIDLSYKLALRIKDLLHLVYASMLSRTHNIKYFLTRDIKDFERIKDAVKQLLQIEIVLIK